MNQFKFGIECAALVCFCTSCGLLFVRHLCTLLQAANSLRIATLITMCDDHSVMPNIKVCVCVCDYEYVNVCRVMSLQSQCADYQAYHTLPYTHDTS